MKTSRCKFRVVDRWEVDGKNISVRCRERTEFESVASARKICFSGRLFLYNNFSLCSFSPPPGNISTVTFTRRVVASCHGRYRPVINYHSTNVEENYNARNKTTDRKIKKENNRLRALFFLFSS